MDSEGENLIKIVHRHKSTTMNLIFGIIALTLCTICQAAGELVFFAVLIFYDDKFIKRKNYEKLSLI